MTSQTKSEHLVMVVWSLGIVTG